MLLLAALVRFASLGRGSLDGDELYTYYDVLDLLGGGAWSPGPRSAPLGYLLIAGAAALLGPHEVALRIVPALAGVGMVAALLWMRRDALPRGAALGAGVLAALSPWLLYHAQTARFYGPLLFFATLATLWALPGPGRAPGRSALAFLAAVLCHPSALLIGPALAAPLRRARSARALALVLAGAAAAGLLLGTFAGEALLDAARRIWVGGDPNRYGTAQLLFGLGYNFGPLTGVLALGGAILARRDARGAVLLPAAVLPPALLVAASLGLGVSLHQRYALAAVPAALLLAGIALDRVGSRRPRAALLLGGLALAAFVPGLAGHLRDGNRHDWRAAAAWLASRAGPEDILVADEHAALHLYLSRLPGFADVALHEEDLVDAAKRFSFARNRRDVWVVVKASRLPRGYAPEFTAWLAEHFDESARIGTPPPPLAKHDNRLVVLHRRERARTLPGTGEG